VFSGAGEVTTFARMMLERMSVSSTTGAGSVGAAGAPGGGIAGDPVCAGGGANIWRHLD